MKKAPILIILLVMALTSTCYVLNMVIFPYTASRIELVEDILSRQAEPPYQYRILQPAMGKVMENGISLLTGGGDAHIGASALLAFITFLAIFFAFHSYLQTDFSERTSFTGAILLQVVIPLSVTGFYVEGDFLNLLFYILGLILIKRGKDRYLPILVALGTLNREQFVFIVVWYFLHLAAEKKLTTQKLILILLCATAWFAAYIGVRMYFGFKPSQFTTALHIANNTANLLRIIPLWTAEVAGFAALCLLAFRKSNLFYKLSFLSLIPYGALFFVNGNMWELAKFLPAFLIMIPMGLQALSGEFIGAKGNPGEYQS